MKFTFSMKDGRRKVGLFTAVLGVAAGIGTMSPVWASGPAGVPASFALPGGSAPTYGSAAEVSSYVTLVYNSYDQAYKAATRLQTAVEAFLADPTEKKLELARSAWINAHLTYSKTEAFRFYGGPIDFSNEKEKTEGPEGRLNAWPLNEAFIDYTKGNPKSGIINDPSIEITPETIRARDQVSDEADVTTGFHAIEFLLYGQDLSKTGPGARPASDYKAGDTIRDRRRLYLQTLTEMVADDLLWLTAQWDLRNEKSYAKEFLALDQRDALGRILTGMATLSGFELSSERMSVALESGDQEDETSCFSDQTHNVYRADQESISNVWFGQYGDWHGAGLTELIKRIDPALEKEVSAQVRKTNAAVAAIPSPVDQVLASPKNSEGRKKIEAAIAALEKQGTLFVAIGKKLGVQVIVASE